MSAAPVRTREQEILFHSPLVHLVVERLSIALPLVVEREDLYQVGVIGLIDALNRYDVSKDCAFSTYAVLRIRGQIIDHLRQRDWVPRGVRERARKYLQAVTDLAHIHGRRPSHIEIAERLGVSLKTVMERQCEANLVQQISYDAPSKDERLGGLDAMLCQDEELTDPTLRLDRDDRKRLVARLCTTLTEQEQQVVQLYYHGGMKMKDIAAVMALTESRICQIHGEIIASLRIRLGDAA